MPDARFKGIKILVTPVTNNFSIRRLPARSVICITSGEFAAVGVVEYVSNTFKIL
jgi:hypothetical protein